MSVLVSLIITKSAVRVKHKKKKYVHFLRKNAKCHICEYIISIACYMATGFPCVAASGAICFCACSGSICEACGDNASETCSNNVFYRFVFITDIKRDNN